MTRPPLLSLPIFSLSFLYLPLAPFFSLQWACCDMAQNRELAPYILLDELQELDDPERKGKKSALISLDTICLDFISGHKTRLQRQIKAIVITDARKIVARVKILKPKGATGTDAAIKEWYDRLLHRLETWKLDYKYAQARFDKVAEIDQTLLHVSWLVLQKWELLGTTTQTKRR